MQQQHLQLEPVRWAAGVVLREIKMAVDVAVVKVAEMDSAVLEVVAMPLVLLLPHAARSPQQQKALNSARRQCGWRRPCCWRVLLMPEHMVLPARLARSGSRRHHRCYSHAHHHCRH